MDWIKQNNFLATFGGIMLAGILGLGFFAISNWKGYSAAIEKFDDTRSKLESLESSPLHPNPENLQKVKTEVDAYEKAVNELYAKLKEEQPPLPTEVSVTEFGQKIQDRLNPFMDKAKGLNITVGDSFYMGMDKYRGQQPPDDEEILSKLEWSLGGIANLVNLTVDSGIESIDEFRRYEEPWENPNAKPAVAAPAPRSRDRGRRTPAAAPVSSLSKMADVTEASRVRMRLTGSPDAISQFFNLVSNDEEYFYWTRWSKVSNEVAKGPDRGRVYSPVPVGDDPVADGDVPAELTPPVAPAADGDPAVAVVPEVETAPAMIDVFPILGTERVRVDVVIDIVRFRDPPAPEKEEKNTRR
jgi:hypothetical protein